VTLEPDWKSIESEVPELAVRSLALLGEGWTAKAYRVNDDLVFKFPKQSSDWEELDREITFLDHARSLLGVPVAEHLFQVRRSAGAPHGYAVYRHLAGDAIDVGAMSEAARTDAAATLARFLRTLHDLQVSPKMERFLRRRDEWELSENCLSQARRTIAPRLTAQERSSLEQLFRCHWQDPENFPKAFRIIHADLGPEHILYAHGALSGILDWGEVCLGDPDYDLGYLYAGFGGAFVREVAFVYGHPDPDRLLRKARYFVTVDQIDAILHGSGRAPAGDERLAWRRLRELLRQA